MVTTLAENVESIENIREVLEYRDKEYRLTERRVVAGVALPPGTELGRIDEDPVRSNRCTVYWRIPDSIVVDVFAIINSEVRVKEVTLYNI